MFPTQTTMLVPQPMMAAPMMRPVLGLATPPMPPMGMATPPMPPMGMASGYGNLPLPPQVPPGAGPVVVGPVIGLVTDNMARVVLEFAQAGQVSLVAVPTMTKHLCRAVPLQPGQGGQVPPVNKSVPALRATVFVLSGLQPLVKYALHLQGPFGTLQNVGSFWTQPQGGYKLEVHQPNFVVKSCDCYYNTRDHVEPQEDLWEDLKERIVDNEIDYMLHIGDNVYNDPDFCDIEKGKNVDVHTRDVDCKWNVARERMLRVPRQGWESMIQEVREIFRLCYRESWAHPPCRFCLANCPNLMIFDDHEVRDDWGDRETDKDHSTLDWFLASQAYFVVCEYQMQLYRDVELPEQNWGPSTWPQRDFYFFAFGDVGVYMQDIRGCKTFHWDPARDRALPMMGVDQWAEVDKALSPGGIFARCRMLLVGGPEPYAYASTGVTQQGAKVVDDMYGHWMAEKHAPECSRFLDLVFKWRDAAPYGVREVLLLGGDVHEGGWTSICHAQGGVLGIGSTSHFQDCDMQQFTASAMSYHLRSGRDQLVSAGTKNVGENLAKGGFSFRHYEWTSMCNYGIIEMFISEEGRAVYSAKLVASKGTCYERSYSYSDYKPAFGEGLTAELRDIAARCSVM